jgi:D-threo-aldose 1-dehydrogenase
VYPFDFFILAMRYTLMEQDALEPDLAMCAERGVSVVGAAVLGSGLLATGPVAGSRYNYVEPTQDQLTKARRIQSVCARYDVPMIAAAIQFPLAHPSVPAVVVGAAAPAEAHANAEHARHPIPAALWNDLKGEELIRSDAPTPGAAS